jgi:hypothetical protein
MSPRPLFREAPDERVRIAQRWQASNVVVVVDPHRDGSTMRAVSGQLIGVATGYGAGGTELAIVDAGGGLLDAYSLARVRAILPGNGRQLRGVIGLEELAELERRAGVR